MNSHSLNYLLAPVILALTKVNGSQLEESPLLSAPIAAQARASSHLQSPINNCRAWDNRRTDSPGRRWISRGVVRNFCSRLMRRLRCGRFGGGARGVGSAGCWGEGEESRCLSFLCGRGEVFLAQECHGEKLLTSRWARHFCFVEGLC